MGERAGDERKKWAPWYVYVVLILGCNLVKQRLLDGFPAAANIAITAVLVAALIFVITAVYRSLSGPKQH